MHEGDLRRWHLPTFALIAKLSYPLYNAKKAAGRASVRVRKHAAVRIDREPSIESEFAGGERRPSVPLTAQTEFLRLDDGDDGKAIV